MLIELFPGTRLNIQCKSLKTSNTIGKTKQTQRTKEVKGQIITQTSIIPTNNKQTNTFRSMSGLGDIGLTICFFVCFGILDVFW